MNATLQNYFNTLCCGGGCTCPEGYTKDAKTGLCVKVETIPATVSQQGICLVPIGHILYTDYLTRIYAAPFVNEAIGYAPGTSSPAIIGELTDVPYHKNDVNDAHGPMNQAAVWIDSDCDGQPNALSAGAQTTIPYTFNNTGAARIIYVGVGGDNYFSVKLNGTTIADSSTSGGNSDQNSFKIWHLIPLTVQAGNNYIDVVATGDGSVSDAVGVKIYDNSASQLLEATADSQLNVVFNSRSLTGAPYDIATCADGWSLDTSGGSGNYVCRRTLTTTCS